MIDRSVTRDGVRPTVERRAGRRRRHIHRSVCLVIFLNWKNARRARGRARVGARRDATRAR